MAMLLSIMASVNNIFVLCIIIYSFIILILSKKILNKNTVLKKILYILPLILSIIHFIINYLHEAFMLNIKLFWSIYLFSILFCLLPLLYNKERLFNKIKILFIIYGISTYILILFQTIDYNKFHNLTYESYTNSFTKAIEILKKEYVLSEHKKIDYDYLLNKYYPILAQAEETNNEQLYFKTMYEFSNEFYDGHFNYGIYFKNNEEFYDRYKFIKDYENGYYGFGTIQLNNGDVICLLVNQNSDAYKQCLRDGMTILKKNNIDVKYLIDTMYIPNTNYPVLEDAKLIKSILLFNSGGETIDLTFIDENNEEKTINIKQYNPQDQQPESSIIYNKIIDTPYGTENLSTKMLNETTGYIYIENEMYSKILGTIGYLFDDATYLKNIIDTKLQLLLEKGMKNLIIDVRGNTGGLINESSAIASLFTKQDYDYSKEGLENFKIYNYTKVKGNGKYANLDVALLINADSGSAGDILIDMLSKCDNIKIYGFTNSNNIAQAIGGKIYLTGGKSYLSYPIHNTYDINGNILIDTNEKRIANVKPDVRVNITKENINGIINQNNDYLLEYVLKEINK